MLRRCILTSHKNSCPCITHAAFRIWAVAFVLEIRYTCINNSLLTEIWGEQPTCCRQIILCLFCLCESGSLSDWRSNSRRRQKCRSGIFHMQILSFIVTYFRSAEVQVIWTPSSFLPKLQIQSLCLPPLRWHLLDKSSLCQGPRGTIRVGWSWPAWPGTPLTLPRCPGTLFKLWAVCPFFGWCCSSVCVQFCSLLSLSSCSFPATDFGSHLAPRSLDVWICSH